MLLLLLLLQLLVVLSCVKYNYIIETEAFLFNVPWICLMVDMVSLG